MANEQRQVGVLGEIGRRDAVEGLGRAIVFGAREHELHVGEPTELGARDREVFFAQLDADYPARGKAPGDGKRGDAGAAGKVEDALGLGRDALDDTPLP